MAGAVPGPRHGRGRGPGAEEQFLKKKQRAKKRKKEKHVRHALNCCACCESVFLTRFNVAKKEAVKYMEREKGDVQNC